MSTENPSCTIYLEKDGPGVPDVFIHGGRYPAFLCALELLRELAEQNNVTLHQLVLTLCQMDEDEKGDKHGEQEGI